ASETGQQTGQQPARCCQGQDKRYEKDWVDSVANAGRLVVGSAAPLIPTSRLGRVLEYTLGAKKVPKFEESRYRSLELLKAKEARKRRGQRLGMHKSRCCLKSTKVDRICWRRRSAGWI